MVAVDQCAYTPATKSADGTWKLGVTHYEDMDNDDPLGNVRLFCTACGEYFFVPLGLINPN
jgi:hypothetical protein